ncbi:YcjF family protein [Methylocapsa palsarum]|uniref:Putative membrane protein n=1 Tax=Methylocapsa palsarum TaxID=1612308 RepID=A0A1I3XDZ7_9HYPH|nr:TIGR01620 family protein [Methylocapsa palsarum]SFK17757.1 putative membrane protein [Methylocapsa palsarum]
MTPDQKRPPRAFRLDELNLNQGEATPRQPVVIESTHDPFEAEIEAITALDLDEAAIEKAQKKGVFARMAMSWSGAFWSAIGGLVSLAAGLWITHLIDDLFARAPALGLIGLVLAGIAALACFVLAAREFSAVNRQRRIAELHIGLARAREADDFEDARRLVRELSDLYAERPDASVARAQLRELSRDIVDGSDLIDIAERTLVEPLDRQVRQEIASAAKRVSVVTALAPRAIIDVIFVIAQAIQLIRRISVIYGGKPGFLGFLKVLRSIGAHIAITGGMAAGDSILQQFLGHGIAARISARLGEGVLNGLLTARVGLSAMAVCRPTPFVIVRAPGVADVAPFLFTKGDKKKGDMKEDKKG